jgi:hypothetical protein
MLLNIALIAIAAAIILFFSKEFSGFAEKIWKKDSMRILLPLFFASLLTKQLESFIYTSLINIKNGFIGIIEMISAMLSGVPYKDHFSVFIVMLLWLALAYGIVFGYEFALKRKFTIASEFVLFTWVFVVCILFMPQMGS